MLCVPVFPRCCCSECSCLLLFVFGLLSNVYVGVVVYKCLWLWLVVVLLLSMFGVIVFVATVVDCDYCCCGCLGFVLLPLLVSVVVVCGSICVRACE